MNSNTSKGGPSKGNTGKDNISKNSIKFDPNDLEGMQALMEKYGDSEFPYWGEAKMELEAAEKEQEETKRKLEQVRGRTRRLKEYLGATAFDESLVRDLVERIEVGADGSVKITY